MLESATRDVVTSRALKSWCRRIGCRQTARWRSGGRGVIGRRCRWLWRTRRPPRGRRPATRHPPLFSSLIIRLSSPIKNYNIISRFIQHIEATTSVYERTCGRVFLNRSARLCGGGEKPAGFVTRVSAAPICFAGVRLSNVFVSSCVIMTCSTMDGCAFKHAIAVAGLLRCYTVMSLSGFG